MQLSLQSSSVEKPSLKSLLQFTSLPFSCEEVPLWQNSWGDIHIILPLPTCKCYANKERLHSACSERRWVFSLLSIFKWRELRNVLRTDECGWGWIVAKSEEMSERTRRSVKRTACAVRAQFDCFLSVWVEAAHAASTSPNVDILYLVLQLLFVFFYFCNIFLTIKVCLSSAEKNLM